MTKYTIEVDSIYAISILAPLAEVIERETEDRFFLAPYMAESLLALLCELFPDYSSEILDTWIKDDPQTWSSIANRFDNLVKTIRTIIEEANSPPPNP